MTDKPRAKTAQPATEPPTNKPPSTIDLIQAAIDAIPDASMSAWAIDSLCRATQATQYRPLFRAAAEQHGEAGVYRLLQIMVRNTDKVRHNQLCLAASQSVAAARTNGKAILPAARIGDLLPAMTMANCIVQAARQNCPLADVVGV